METIDGTISSTKQSYQGPVIVSNKLYNVLSSVTNIKFITSMKEVLNAVKEYIIARNLFDPLNPSRISCSGDELGAVFGIQEFTVPDVGKFLLKHVFPAGSSDAGSSFSSGDIIKRKSNELDNPAMKRSRSETMVLYLPPSPGSINLSDDSAESYQGYETAVVKDTSDDNFCFSHVDSDDSEEDFSILTVEETFDIEYEVESLSSNSFSSGSDSDDDSDMDTLKSAIITVICKSDSDMEFWADKSSDDDYSLDAESSDSDKSCECGDNACEKCFHKRLEWFASEKRTTHKPKRKNRSKRKRAITSKNCDKEEPSSASQSDEANVASPASSSQESSSSGFSSQDSDTKLCFLCCERPANGTIIHAHSKYAHTISCYPCARKLQHQKKRCPICRRRIHRVVCSIAS